MPISMKPSVSSSKYQKVLDRAMELYPNIEWVVMMPDPDIIKDYGEGFIIQGYKGTTEAVYFVLFEDPRKDTWIHMIANQLEGKDGTE